MGCSKAEMRPERPYSFGKLLKPTQGSLQHATPQRLPKSVPTNELIQASHIAAPQQVQTPCRFSGFELVCLGFMDEQAPPSQPPPPPASAPPPPPPPLNPPPPVIVAPSSPRPGRGRGWMIFAM